MTAKKVEKAELAKSLGISRTTLWRYFKNEKDIPSEILFKICEILEIEILKK